MNEQAEVQKASGLDTAKLVVAVALLIAGLTGYYWFDSQSDWLRIGYVVAGLVLAVFMAWQTEMGRSLLTFSRTSWTEVRKMVWPTRQETLTTTMFVLLTVLVVAVFMWLLDLGLFAALRGITGQGS